MKRVYIIGMATAVVASVAAVSWPGLFQNRSETPETVLSRLPALTSPVANCQFNTGDHAAFQLTSEASVEGQSDRFNGTMSWDVEQVTSGTARIRAVFNQVIHTQDLVEPEERANSPEGVPFFLEIANDCSVLTQAFSSQWDAKTQMLVKTQLDNLAFALPLAGETNWNAELLDGIGNYTANYRLTGTSPLMIQRQKVTHQTRGGGEAFGINISLDKAQALAVFDEAKPTWWQSIDGQEQITIKMPGQQVVTMSQQFKMQRNDEKFVTVPALVWDDTEVSDPYQDAAQVAELVTTRQSYHEAHDAFDQAIASTPPQYYEAALELGAWLKKHPEDVALVVAELWGKLDDQSRPTAFLALQLSGTPEARDALIELMDDGGLTAVDQARAASALSDWAEPTREVADILLVRAERDDMAAMTSILGVGSMVSKTEEPGLKAYLVSSLSGRLQIADSNSDVQLTLDAIGNTGDEEFVDVLSSELSAASAGTRRHAAQALSKLPAETAKPVLLARLSEESDPRVRTTLISALNNTGAAAPELVSMLDQRLTRAADNERVAIIDLLGKQQGEEAQQALVQQFKRETNARIKQQIGQYVSAEALR